MARGTVFDFEPLLSSDAVARRGPGVDAAGASNPKPMIQIAGGQPDPASMPVRELAAAAARVLSSDRAALLYGPRDGFAGLKQVVVEKTAALERLRVTPDDLIVTNGSSQAIAMSAQAILDRGDPILIDEFSWGVRIFSGFGATMLPVRYDRHGPIPEDLEAGVAAADAMGRRVKMFYTLPNFQNPMGVTTSVERRLAVLEIAARHGFPILEDDAYFELRFEGEHLPSYFELDESRSMVIRTGTFSKILGAGVRLGWAMAPRDLLRVLLLYKLDLGASPFTSRIVAEYMREHMLEHIDELVGVYRRKRDTMLDGLESGLEGLASWDRPEGGFFVWVRLPAGGDAREVDLACETRGVAIWTGADFDPAGADARHARLCYSFATPEEIERGVATFCDVVRALA